jgi:uncharacterized membrane protein (UPF0136 family)
MNNFFRKKTIIALIFGFTIGLVFTLTSKQPLLGLIIALVFFVGFRQRRNLT